MCKRMLVFWVSLCDYRHPIKATSCALVARIHPTFVENSDLSSAMYPDQSAACDSFRIANVSGERFFKISRLRDCRPEFISTHFENDDKDVFRGLREIT